MTAVCTHGIWTVKCHVKEYVIMAKKVCCVTTGVIHLDKKLADHQSQRVFVLIVVMKGGGEVALVD